MIVIAIIFIASASCGRQITVTTDNWANVIQGTDGTVGQLQPGDVITFPGTAASPITYSINGNLNIMPQGTLNEPIVVQAAEIGGAIINQMSGQNILNIQYGNDFQILGLKFTGGSEGIRFGQGTADTDVCSNALLQDLEIYNTMGSMITANTPAASGNVKIMTNITIRRCNMHTQLDPSGTNECMYLGANANGVTEVVRFSSGLIEYNLCHDTLPAASGYGAALQLKAGANNNIVRFNVFYNVLIGVFLYDDYQHGANIVYGNVVFNSTDNCMQVTAGAEIFSNVMFGEMVACARVHVFVTQAVQTAATMVFRLQPTKL
jgi:hypothetical protein